MDEMSAGNPVLEALQLGVVPQAEGFAFSNSRENPKKINMINSLKLGFEQKRVHIPSQLNYVIEELRFYEYRRTDNNTLQMAAASGKHDDCVIALALAWVACSVPTTDLEVRGVAPDMESKGLKSLPAQDFCVIGSKEAPGSNPFGSPTKNPFNDY